MLSRLTEFIQLHENYKQIETDEFVFEIPDPNKLLTAVQLKEYSGLTAKLANGSFPKDANLKISCSDFDQLFQQLNNLQNFYNEVDKFQIDFTSSVVGLSTDPRTDGSPSPAACYGWSTGCI